ncbi:type VII secretion protein EccB [Streptomyces nigra]|uniref:type VII secretion protein EccB n=1 Tax=Streptomyces nigra TaxID=1827580 RepID=UPI00364CC6F0
MQTSGDHVQAHQFMTRRLVSALVTGDVTGNEMPARRATLGLFFGILAALLAMGGFWLYGLLSPGGNSAWRQPGSIVLEKETGNRYLFIDGKLRPVANLSSALLGAGSNPQMRSVSRNSLRGVEHGPPVGIPGAPDVLPEPSRVVSGSLLVCAAAGREGAALTHLVIDPDIPTTVIAKSRRLRVAAPDGRDYLVVDGVGYRLKDQAVTVAVGLDTTPPIRVSSTWITALPKGRDLAPFTVKGAGERGPVVAGKTSRRGDLFEVTSGSGTHRYYLSLADGLAPVSSLEYALLSVDGAKARSITAADVAAARRSSEDSLLNRFPDLLGGVAAAPPPTLCLRQELKEASPKRTRAPEVRELVSVPAQALTGEPVQVAAGHGLLGVAMVQKDDRVVPLRFLITDLGKRYYVPGDQELRALGLDGAPQVLVPAQLLAYVPSGPDLTAEAATRTPNEVT